MQRQIISRKTHHDTCATIKEQNHPEKRKERSLRQLSMLWKQNDFRNHKNCRQHSSAFQEMKQEVREDNIMKEKSWQS